MAGQSKCNLDYFKFHTNIFDDPKIFALTEEYGPLGEAIYFRILCMIYDGKDGYYMKFEDLDQLSRKLTREIGSSWVKKDKVLQVIQFLAKCQLLDQCFMQENVLTSLGIQNSWLEAMIACKRKIPENRKFWLL